MHFSFLLSSLALLATVSAMPSSLLVRNGKTTPSLTTEQLLEIAPNAETCEGAEFPEECATAEQAVPHIVHAFVRYGVKSPAEQAALISLMALESGEFKYNRNHFPPPGTPGQGSTFLPTQKKPPTRFAKDELVNGGKKKKNPI